VSSPVVVYSLARLGIFLAVAAVLYALGARSLLLILLAALISGLLSIRLLARQRDAVAARLTERPVRRGGRLDDAASAEDD
jgi:hypothetical protein